MTYGGNSIYVAAVDTISDDFDISLGVINEHTNGQAQQLNFIDAQVMQLDRRNCGPGL